MDLEEFCKKAIGVPFKILGRSYDEWDCWGLVCMAYQEIYNIELPSYDECYQSVKQRDVIAKLCKKKKEIWHEVSKAQPGDVILVYRVGRAMHVGLAIDRNRMLHVEHGINTCLQRISEFRVEGIYRYGK